MENILLAAVDRGLGGCWMTTPVETMDDEKLREMFAPDHGELQEDMKAQGVTGRYTSRENLHLTLAFIGEYPDPEDVREAISEVPFTQFDLALDGVGSFSALFLRGSGRSRFPWLRCALRKCL